MLKNELIEKAKKRARLLQKKRQDPRYLKTLGKLRREGLLDVRDVPEYRGQVFLQDALWAAQLEPRVFELMPAIVARRPGFFAFMELPADLDQVVREIKAGRARTFYQGIAPEKYMRWVSFVGRSDAKVKVMKSFRLSPEDLEILARLAEGGALTQTEVLQRAIREYARGRG